MDVSAELSRTLGKATLVEPGRLPAYATDKADFRGSTPAAAVRPRNAGDVAKALEFCNRRKLRVVARGAGSSLTGAAVPGGKWVVIDTSSLDRILEIHVQDRYAVVEPGATIGALNKRLARYGYFYPPDPASAAFATIGGSIGTNAGGLKAGLYGTTKDWVLGLEVVLPNGTVINTGSRTLKRSIGYDLTALLAGSEGTLGIITKAILKIWPLPEAHRMFAAYFGGMKGAVDTVAELEKLGIALSAAEFIDKSGLALVRKHNGIRIPPGSNYILIVETVSNKEAADRVLDQAIMIAKSNGALSTKPARSEGERADLFDARRHMLISSKEKAERTHRRVVIADIVVPLSQLHLSLREMHHAVARSSLDVILYGHAGEGNVHADIAYLPGDAKETKAMNALQTRFGEIAIKHCGSVSGEHGIGLEKKDLLKKEFAARSTSESIELMKRIKKQFDPNGILNPGKIFD